MKTALLRAPRGAPLEAPRVLPRGGLADAECATLARDFLGAIDGCPRGAALLDGLNAVERAHLQRRMARHLGLLFDGAADDAVLADAARAIARAHALCGVRLPQMAAAYALLRDKLEPTVQRLAAGQASHEALAAVLDARLAREVQVQAEVFERLDEDAARALRRLDLAAEGALDASELARHAVHAFGALDGCLAALFLVAGGHGDLRVEAAFGSAACRYAQALEDGRVPRLSSDARRPGGRGIAAQAWRSGRIVCVDAWSTQAALGPWQALGTELGFRSSAALPLRDGRGGTLALLCAYSTWPGFFSTPRVMRLLRHAQRCHGAALRALRVEARTSTVPARDDGGAS